MTGIFSGMRPNSYALSLNTVEEWSSNSIFSWIKVLIGGWSPSHLVRATLEFETSYSDAVKKLSESSMAKSVSFNLVGTLLTQNTLISRSILGDSTQLLESNWFTTNTNNETAQQELTKQLQETDKLSFGKS